MWFLFRYNPYNIKYFAAILFQYFNKNCYNKIFKFKYFIRNIATMWNVVTLILYINIVI